MAIETTPSESISMGVRGLPGFLAWASPTLRTSPSWEDLKGKTIGIDVLGLLYKAKGMKQSIFAYLARLVIACKRHNIRPVVIFDGKPPEEKKGTLQSRKKQREDAHTIHHIQSDTVVKSWADVRALRNTNSTYLTAEDRDQAKQLLYACGVLSLNASGEADSVLAHFSKRGQFAAVISNDFDLLARGVTTLLVPEFCALPGDTTGWAHYHLPTILKTIELTYDQFLDMCVLMGCDYTSGQTQLPYKTAYWAVRYKGGSLEELAAHYQSEVAPYQKARGLLSGLYDTQESLMGEKQWEKWVSGTPVLERDTLDLLRATRLKALTSDEFNSLRDSFCDSYM